MQVKAVFSIDPTGFEQDITEMIEISSEVCLFCYFDFRDNTQRLHDEVQKALEAKGYDFTHYFSLLKVYVI